MTVSECLILAAHRLVDAEVDNPRLDSQLLLAHILQCRREDLVREPARVIDEDHASEFQALLARRERREPLPYVVGHQAFYGRTFRVTSAVLIPRPETELLVKLTLTLLQDVPAPRIVDVGCGSGCIAVTLAAERPDARVWATDISAAALVVSAENARALGASGSIEFIRGDLLAPVGRTDLNAVVSNPPYVAEAEIPSLQPEVRDFEPRQALTAGTGPHGDALYPRLFAQARQCLSPGGWVLVEVGLGQAERVAGMARASGFEAVESMPDWAGIERIVFGRQPARE